MNIEANLRIVIRSPEFDEYYSAQRTNVQEKYDYVMALISGHYLISEKFVKSIETSDLYEVRVSIGNNEHRTLLFAIDNPNFMQSTRVIFLNSFLKKDSKQYRREIKKANEILKRYLK